MSVTLVTLQSLAGTRQGGRQWRGVAWRGVAWPNRCKAAFWASTAFYLSTLGYAVFCFVCSQAIIFANIATYLGSARFRNSRFWHSVTALEDYIRLHKMPRHIAVKVQYYFQFVWQRFQGIDEEAVVAELPDDLRADVLVYRSGPLVYSSRAVSPSDQRVPVGKVHVSGQCRASAGPVPCRAMLCSAGPVPVPVPCRASAPLPQGDWWLATVAQR